MEIFTNYLRFQTGLGLNIGYPSGFCSRSSTTSDYYKYEYFELLEVDKFVKSLTQPLFSYY